MTKQTITPTDFLITKESTAIRLRKWITTFEMPFPFQFLNSFKWFRKLFGGTWHYLRIFDELGHFHDSWTRWEGGFRSALLKTETYSFFHYTPKFPLRWFANKKWFRQFCGGTWYFNRYWYDAGIVCIFVWERKYMGSQGGNTCTINQERY